MTFVVSLIFLVWLLLFVKKPTGNALIYALFLFPPAIIVFSWPIEFYVKRWVSLALLLLLFFKHGAHSVKSFPLKAIITVMFLESFILILPDGRFDLLHRILYPFMDALDIYLPLLLAYSFALLTGIKIEKLFKPLTVCCLIIELYGLFNLVTGLNPVNQLLVSLYNGSVSSEAGDRVLVSSIYRSSFDFGFNSALFVLLYIYYYITHKNSFGILQFIALGLSVLGVFICGSRTVVVAFFLAVFVYILFIKSMKVKIIAILGGFLVLFILYKYVPAVSNMLSITMQSIAGTADVTGSSIDQRNEQLLGAFAFMMQNPLWGNGFKYIFIDLDWANHTIQEGMAGYESLLFTLMIERGLLGIVVYLFFFVCIIYYFMRKSIAGISHATLGLSIIILFLVFAVFTGALDAWLNTMVLCGILIANTESMRNSVVIK